MLHIKTLIRPERSERAQSEVAMNLVINRMKILFSDIRETDEGHLLEIVAKAPWIYRFKYTRDVVRVELEEILGVHTATIKKC